MVWFYLILLGLAAVYFFLSRAVRQRFFKPFEQVLKKVADSAKAKDQEALAQAMQEYKKVYPKYMLGFLLTIGLFFVFYNIAEFLDPNKADDLTAEHKLCLSNITTPVKITAHCTHGENSTLYPMDQAAKDTVVLKHQGECPINITVAENVCFMANGTLTSDNGTRTYLYLGLPFFKAVVGAGPIFLFFSLLLSLLVRK